MVAPVAWKWNNQSNNTTGNAGSLTVNIGSANPNTTASAIAVGDKLIAAIVVHHGTVDPGTISVTGFTSLVSDFNGDDGASRLWVGYRNAQAGDSATGSSFQASWTSGNTCTGASWALLDYSGVSVEAPPAQILPQAGYTTPNMTAPTVTPTTASDIMLAIFSVLGSKGPYTKPVSMTTRADVASTSSDRMEVMVCEEQLASALATGQRVATAGTGEPSVSASVILSTN